MAKQGNQGGPASMPAKEQQGRLVTDSRFAAVHHDPRFQRFPKAKAKVEIDERFSGMFKDPSFQVRSVVDKRGRKTGAVKKNEDMRKYYRLRDEHEEEAKQAQQAAQQDADAAGGGEDFQPEASDVLGKVRVENDQGQAARANGAKAALAERRRATRGAASAPGTAAAAAAGKARKRSKQQAERQGQEGDEPERGAGREAGEPSSSSSEGEEEELDEAAERWARMRGLAGPETSSDEEEEEEGGGTRELATSSDDGDQGEERLGSSSDEEESEGEDVEALKQEWGVGALAANPDEQVPLSEATRRLAVVDLDWAHIRAVDVLAVLRSFLPKGGRLERVTVYPSDYGLQRMAEEAAAGPQGIWKATQAAAEGSEVPKGRAAAAGSKGRRRHEQQQDLGVEGDSDDVEESGSDAEPAEPGSAAATLDESQDDSPADGGSDSGDDAGDGHPSPEDDSSADEDDSSAGEDDDGGEVDQRRLLLYERSKLRWYYAVAEFGSVEAAAHIYDNCDGMEFLKSACKFDLRFVPDEQSFEGRQVRDSASGVPSDYSPPTFQTKALQHTNVSLTWDADDEGRKRALTKKMTADDLKEDDLKAYLASETEHSDEGDAIRDQPGAENEEDEAAVRERYRRLLLGADVAEERKGKKDWGADERGGSGSEDTGSSDEGEEEDGRGGRDGPKARVKNDKSMEMEVTFLPGLENLGERLLAKKRDQEARKGETVWDAYMRRKREKRHEAKQMGKKLVESDDDDDSEDDYGGAGGSGDEHDVPADVKDDPFFQHEENPFDDPFFQDDGEAAAAAASNEEGASAGTKGAKGKGSKKGALAPAGAERKSRGSKADKEQRRQQQEQEARRNAELEMLLMDEAALAGTAAKAAAAAAKDGQAPGSKLSKKERMRLKKEARRRERTEGSDDEDMQEAQGSFHVDLADPRFREMFTSHHFALDPTDPRYARSDATQAIAQEAAKRRDGLGREKVRQNGAAAGSQHAQQQQPRQPSGKAALDTVNGQGVAGGGGSADLRFMVASLKRKSAQLQQQGQQAVGAAKGAAPGDRNGARSAAGGQRKKQKKQRV